MDVKRFLELVDDPLASHMFAKGVPLSQRKCTAEMSALTSPFGCTPTAAASHSTSW
jgi:hypothetical protein